MAKAKAEITIFNIKDVKSVTRYYLLQSSTAAAPSKPTTITPGSNWKTTEPSYTDGSTNTLYFVDLTIMSDGKTFSYSDVSKSSSYEAAKSAWNKANNAQNTANSANDKAHGIADNIYTPKTTTIDGGKITTGSIKAVQIDVENLFAQNIKATGSISGATIKGASGEFTKEFSVKTPITTGDNPINFQIMNDDNGSFIGLKSQEQAQSYVKLDGTTASLVGQSISIGASKSAVISAQMGIGLSGSDVSIGKALTVEKDVSISGDYYRNGNRIGETISGNSTTAKSIPSGTWTNTNSKITLPPGVYIAIGQITFAASSGGRLGVRFATADQGFNQTTQTVPGTSTSATAYLQCQWILSVTETTTYYLQAWQSTGKAVNASSTYMKAVRIA